MSSGTSFFATKKAMAELAAKIAKAEEKTVNVATNVARDLQDTRNRSLSVAMCFDALLTVLDQRRKKGTPAISDEVRAQLDAMRKHAEESIKKAQEEKNANPPSNER